jgi:dTMP kinase
VRAVLLRRNREPIDPWAEALLFSACRAQLVSEVIRPALEAGSIVVADRFADSTLAYQGTGRGLATSDLALLIRLATSGLQPDLTLLLDVPARTGLDRLGLHGKKESERVATDQISFFEELGIRQDWNRFEDEGLALQERVRAAYLALAQAEPARWVTVDASQTLDAVADAIWQAVQIRLPAPAPRPI